ncbi:MAG: type IV pilus secretin PilQ [bacterium]
MKKRDFKSIIFIAAFFASISLLYASVAAYAGQAATGAGAAGEPQYVNSVSKQGTVKSLFVDPADMKVSFDFQNASVADVIRMIAKVSNMNVLIGSGVKGTVTMKMHNVPLKNVMSIVMEAYGLGMVKRDGIYYINSTGTIASVVSAEKKAKAISEHKITKIVPINYVSATGLMDKIKTVLSSEGKVMYDKSLHSLLITDIPNHVARAVKLVKMLDKRTPEVEIVAKIVEVSTEYSNSLGINWNGNVTIPPAAAVASYGAPSFVTPTFTGPSFNGQASTSAGTFTVGILNHNGVDLSATLSALESLSKAKTISSPKVVVLNNQQANIEKGETIYYPGAASITGAPGTLITVNANLSLAITPHIMANGNVKLKINATNDTPVNFSGTAPPSLETQSVTSTVIVDNGSTVVLGGVYTTTKNVVNSGIPGLMSIPLLGWFFKTRNVTHNKDELLIFITPRIINN